MKITWSAAQLFILQPLPHTPFLSLAGAVTCIIFVTTKHVFCHNKNMLVMTKCFCHDTCVTNICRNKRNFVRTSIILSGQTCVCCILSGQKFCHDEHTFVMTKDVFCHDMCLSYQNFCHDKNYTYGSSSQ